MLAVAAPNLLSESQTIKSAAMNGYARSVAVAVQSKLYGIRNSGIDENLNKKPEEYSYLTEYSYLNKNTEKVEITMDTGKNKTCRLIRNFGDDSYAEYGKYFLSGAMTDPELFQKGNIIVIYNPETADVLYTFYTEKSNEISIDDLLTKDEDTKYYAIDGTYLKNNFLGLYSGYGAPAPRLNESLPRFDVSWEEDDELALVITVGNKNDVDSKLLSVPLGIEKRL